MDKYRNLATHELDNVIGGSGIDSYFKGRSHFIKPVIGLPTPVNPKTVTI